MSQASLGTPINSSLQFNPGGNPILASGGGAAGLGLDYGNAYNSYLQTAQQQYNNISQGYQTVMNNVGNTLGQGGTWGVAQPAAQAIADQYAQQSGGAIQNSIDRGIGGSTAAVAQQRGASLDASKAYSALGSSLASTYAGYEANLGQAQLGFMNSVNVQPPNAGAYNQLLANQQAYAQAQQKQRLGLRAASLSRGLSSLGGGGGGSVSGLGSAGQTNASKFNSGVGGGSSTLYLDPDEGALSGYGGSPAGGSFSIGGYSSSYGGAGVASNYGGTVGSFLGAGDGGNPAEVGGAYNGIGYGGSDQSYGGQYVAIPEVPRVPDFQKEPDRVRKFADIVSLIFNSLLRRGDIVRHGLGFKINASGGTGTVTSVAQTVPVEFIVSGSPITTSGTLAITKATETANTVWAGPTTGSAAVPTFRALVTADMPSGTGTVTSVGLSSSTTDLTVTGSTPITTSGSWSLTVNSAPKLTTARSIAMSGDVTWTVSFDGSGNVTAAGTIANNAVTTAKINNAAVTLAKIANAAASSMLLGSGATGSGSAYVEITLGTNLSMSGTTLNASSGGGGTGTVTTVSVVSANGVSGTVANATTTPAITIALGAITPTSVNTVVISGSSTPTLAVTGTTTVSGSNTGDQTITLTGNVTGSGTGRFAATIASNAVTTSKINNSAVTYAKIQNVSATSRALGRNSAGAGVVEEVTMSQLLDWVGSAAQGDILYRGASTWVRLPARNGGAAFRNKRSQPPIRPGQA